MIFNVQKQVLSVNLYGIKKPKDREKSLFRVGCYVLKLYVKSVGIFIGNRRGYILHPLVNLTVRYCNTEMLFDNGVEFTGFKFITSHFLELCYKILDITITVRGYRFGYHIIKLFAVCLYIGIHILNVSLEFRRIKSSYRIINSLCHVDTALYSLKRGAVYRCNYLIGIYISKNLVYLVFSVRLKSKVIEHLVNKLIAIKRIERGLIVRRSKMTFGISLYICGADIFEIFSGIQFTVIIFIRSVSFISALANKMINNLSSDLRFYQIVEDGLCVVGRIKLI